jgi:hypothetical protein
MNESKKLETKRSPQILSEASFDDFFQKDDVLKMSVENIENVFEYVYKNILKEAVYPHLSKTKLDSI